MKTSIQNGSVIFTEGKDRYGITLHRTLRLPEDGQTHALPPSLGQFPIKRVEDYKDKVPAAWREHKGVFFPMWQREAMWLSFHHHRRPFAIKVAAGKINAVSGKEWTKELAPSDTSGSGDPRQDYMVAPPQRWLDGFNSGEGIIKQFVAMPLGMGYTVEGQVTGKEDFGGLQIMAIPPKAGLLEPKPYQPPTRLAYSSGATNEYSSSNIVLSGAEGKAKRPGILRSRMGSAGGSSTGGSTAVFSTCSLSDGPVAADGIDDWEGRNDQGAQAAEMGLAAGGSMSQKIYPDPHGLDTWDLSESGRLYIHIVNSQMYEEITGEKPPKSPITAQTYTQHGYPWFKLWEDEMGDVGASETLSGIKTVAQKDADHGFKGQMDDSSVAPKNPLLVSKVVQDGSW